MTHAADNWEQREQSLIKEFEGGKKFFNRWCERNRIAHRVTGIIVLICAILAPIAVASTADAGLGVFGVSATNSRVCALISTLLIAFSEGLRRIFTFDERWRVCAELRQRVFQLRNWYEMEQLSHEVGTPEWVKNLRYAQEELLNIYHDHVRDFARRLRDNDARENQRKLRARSRPDKG